MSSLLTPQALAEAGPLLLETFFKHYLFRSRQKSTGQAREDLMYDEAFVLMKTFLEIATTYPVAALQKFGLTPTPTPPWVGLHRVLIPHSTLDLGAEFLIKAFGGPEMAYKIAGGSKWWQVRAGPGLEGEWIIMKKDWKEYRAAERDLKADKLREDSRVGLAGADAGLQDNGQFRKEMDELRCMLYIHGGAYYWGSINTHRYTIWRYARKMHGRCFAVNYRKAPQYPFPCAIQDCLSAYLYLTRPPPEAKHRPVPPHKIVIGGDSAGGGLVLALLQILRDTEGLELPAGAVLISPWSDMTHSFPSVLQNTPTDIVPPYGFIHKPSSLWPPPPPALTAEIQSRLKSRVREAVANAKTSAKQRRDSVAGKSDKEESALEQEFGRERRLSITSPLVSIPASRKSTIHASDPPSRPTSSKSTKGQEQTALPIAERGDEEYHPGPRDHAEGHQPSADPAKLFGTLQEPDSGCPPAMTTLAQCDTPLIVHTKDETLVLDTQCQLYATNAQLCHPWISPVLGYLGGLPPLFVCAGNNEVLRDEIIYIAHKAANPEKYPIRDDVKAMYPALQGIEERYGPTNVHLQVYDGVCHDLPLFSMTKPARGLFRAIASFARFVTPRAPGSLSVTTSLAASRQDTRSEQSSIQAAQQSGQLSLDQSAAFDRSLTVTPISTNSPHQASQSTSTSRSLTPLDAESGQNTRSQSPLDNSAPSIDSTDSESTYSTPYSVPLPSLRPKKGTAPRGDDAGFRFGEDDDPSQDGPAPPGSAGYSGIYRGPHPFIDYMIRERVAKDGVCRPLEPAEELQAMQMPQDEVGVIKEAALHRYLNGQALWDKRYSRALKTIQKHRFKNLKNAKYKDTSKIVAMWKDKVKERHRAEHESKVLDHELLGENGGASPEGSESASGWETDATESSVSVHGWRRRGKEEAVVDKGKGKGKGKGKEKEDEDNLDLPEDMLDQSWSWTWALHSECPPPSAVVSRRDFGEARKLALMADRMDSAGSSRVHGLSIWVGLAAFFSSSPERNKAHDALKTAHEAQKAERRDRKEAVKKGEKAQIAIDGQVREDGQRNDEIEAKPRKSFKTSALRREIRKVEMALGFRKHDPPTGSADR